MQFDFDFTNVPITDYVNIILTIIVLIYTFRTWNLKRGQSVRASCQISITDKPFISSVIIENLKDRDLVIYGIYLKFASNVYLDLLDIDFSQDKYNHIIPALSSRIFELGQPLFYTKGIVLVDMEDIIKNNSYSIILRTSEGKITAKNIKNGWHPRSLTGTYYIRPSRYYTKNAVPNTHYQSEQYIDYTSFDNSIQYVATIKISDDLTYDFEIPPRRNYIPFQKLRFTAETLQSSDTLYQYLLKSRSEQLIQFEQIIKIENIKQKIDGYKKGLIDEPKYSKVIALDNFQFLRYKFSFRLKTLCSKIKKLTHRQTT